MRVGLVGAGPWARAMHAPVLAAGPETTLSGVWARRPEAAAEIAALVGTSAAQSYAELLDGCEAVAFAVAPDVQARLAPQAVAAGKAVLLEKPLALRLEDALALADAVRDAGLPSLLVLTKRFHPRTRDFLTAAANLRDAGPLLGIDGRYLHSGMLAGPFAHGWRLAKGGALVDLGPHLLDLADAAGGPIVAIRGSASGNGAYLALTCWHEAGTVTQLALSGSVRTTDAVTRLDLAGAAGVLSYDTAGMDHDECWPILRAEFAAAVRRGAPVTCDAERGRTLAYLLDAAERSLATGETVHLSPR